MNKFVAALLALCIMLPLAACDDSNKPAEITSPEGAEPSESVPVSGDNIPAESPSASSKPALDNTADSVGFYTDDVDWFAREPYKIVFIQQTSHFINSSLEDMFEKWGGLLNYSLTAFDAGGDQDKYLNAMSVYASEGADGFLLDADNTFSARVQELADDIGIPYMPTLLPFLDSEGHFSYPSVGMDNYAYGAQQAKWLYDNMNKYFEPDADWADVGFISVTYSPVKDMSDRSTGAVDYYRVQWPDIAESNLFISDGASGTMSAETAFDNVGAVISANAQFEYWVIQTVTEDFGQGSARALEQLGFTQENAIVNCIGGVMLIGEWEGGYEGTWVSAIHIVQEFLSEGMICGLIALIDGRATPETLFQNYIKEGEKYGTPVIESTIIEIDTYKDYLAYIDEYFSGRIGA
ncbi:MAG: substrate-binding domain-containing protein [Oscillospiraceae bacterium]|jgi:ABC-type sugar transport system substrate-binding protein|nr:substrate-binding domain-containing protein [Oscillospiraceae bacterium]